MECSASNIITVSCHHRSLKMLSLDEELLWPLPGILFLYFFFFASFTCLLLVHWYHTLDWQNLSCYQKSVPFDQQLPISPYYHPMTTMSLGSDHVGVTNGRFSFSYDWILFKWMCTIFSLPTHLWWTLRLSWLLWIMLQWMRGCKYLFNILILFLSAIYLEVWLLDQMRVLFLNFCLIRKT